MNIIKNLIINMIDIVKEKLTIIKLKYLVNIKIEFELSNKKRENSNT